MSNTKNEAYREMCRTGKIVGQRARIFDCLLSWGEQSRNTLADRLDMRLASVCGRVRELLDEGVIYVVREERDPETGVNVEVLNVKPLSGQLKLF